jgi:hypothetical protein
MANHGNAADGKSRFATRVESLIGEGQTPRNAVVQAANENGIPISAGDVGDMPNLSASNLRSGLGFNTIDYDPTGGPCPNGINEDAIKTALLGIE